MKRHLIGFTRREFSDLLLAVKAEADWAQAYGAPACRKRYERLERVLTQKLENLERERRAA